MSKHHKGQTSLEFLIIIMALLILAMFVVLFLSSSFDLNIAVYKTKNVTLQQISQSQLPIVINTVSYNYSGDSLNLTVNLNNSSSVSCPSFDYNDLIAELKRKTRFETIIIQNNC